MIHDTYQLGGIADIFTVTIAGALQSTDYRFEYLSQKKKQKSEELGLDNMSDGYRSLYHSEKKMF
jgi:hypothetical protein